MYDKVKIIVTKIHKRIFYKLAEFDKIRFGAVGALNTMTDLLILLWLGIGLGVPWIFANAGSTSAALTVSYILNKQAVFMDTRKHNFKQILLFVIVTLIGLWLIQGAVLLTMPTFLWMFFNLTDTMTLVLSKIAATVVSLFWNYWWYSKVVFHPASKKPGRRKKKKSK